MGGDIAAWCALRGLTVTLQDQNAERLAPAMGRAAKLFAERLKDPRRVRDAIDRLIPDVAGDGVARADVIIEAIFENVDAKRSAVRRARERSAQPDAILATNTSIDSARGHRRRAARSVAADRPALLQSGRADDAGRGRRRRATRDAALVARGARRSCAQIDKLPLPVKSAPGFLVNRVLAPYLMAAMRCVDEGIAPETVDEAALAFGMPMGPIELADTVGLDICVAVGKHARAGRRAAAAAADRARRRRHSSASKTGAGSTTGSTASRRSSAPRRGARRDLAQRLIDPLVARGARRRSPRASSRTPTSSMPARSSARASRRFAAVRCTTRAPRRHAR